MSHTLGILLGVLMTCIGMALLYFAGFSTGRRVTINQARAGEWVCYRGVCLKLAVIDAKNEE